MSVSCVTIRPLWAQVSTQLCYVYSEAQNLSLSNGNNAIRMKRSVSSHRPYDSMTSSNDYELSIKRTWVLFDLLFASKHQSWCSGWLHRKTPTWVHECAAALWRQAVNICTDILRFENLHNFYRTCRQVERLRCSLKAYQLYTTPLCKITLFSQSSRLFFIIYLFLNLIWVNIYYYLN